MADGGMDPCECVWNHEMSMQRLLNLLRNSQTSCTDNECIQDGPLPGDPAGAGFSTMMLMMIGWIVVATALFLFRPAAMRRSIDEKPASSRRDGGDTPPAPPVN
jgi:hypothetical protein